jgi:hypothetical protein
MVDLGGVSVEFACQRSTDRSVKFHVVKLVRQPSDLRFVSFLTPSCVCFHNCICLSIYSGGK